MTWRTPMSAAAVALLAGLLVACEDEAKPAAPPPASKLSEPETSASRFGELALTASPAEAFAFVDGLFIGSTDDEKPLVAALASGKYQLRLTRSGHQDVLHDLEIVTDQRVTLHATLASWAQRMPQSRVKVLWGLGTRARGMLGEGDRESGEGKARRFEDVYLIEGKKGDRRILAAALPKNQLEILVRHPDGTPVPVEVTSKTPPGGVPGRQCALLDYPIDGTLEVAVRPRLVLEVPLPYVIHHGRGFEDESNHPNPRFRRRRWPPRELLTPEELEAQAALRARIESGEEK